jgi:hypothetical protein
VGRKRRKENAKRKEKRKKRKKEIGGKEIEKWEKK